MRNVRMQQKLDKGDAVDIAKCERTEAGVYVLLPDFDIELDYCDSETEEWVWWIGKCLVTGRIIASTSQRLMGHPDYMALWIR